MQLRHKEEAELERRVAADLTRSLHVALDKGLVGEINGK